MAEAFPTLTGVGSLGYGSPMDASLPPSLKDAYRRCEELAFGHYENFPVASLLLSRSLRPHVAALYAFARTADDFADEPPSVKFIKTGGAMSPIALAKGDGPAVQKWRLLQLAAWEKGLRKALAGKGSHPYLAAFANTMRTFDIPLTLPLRLLKAFRMDASFKPFRDRESLLDYCRHSADPVGRMVLLIHGLREETLHHLSDRICTGLQLVNFWQDTSQDLARGRIHYPRSEMKKAGVTEKDLLFRGDSPAVRALVRGLVDATESLFRSGFPLADRLPGRLKYEIRATCLGGLAILNKIRASDYNVLSVRPRLSARDKAAIGFKTLLGRPL